MIEHFETESSELRSKLESEREEADAHLQAEKVERAEVGRVKEQLRRLRRAGLREAEVVAREVEEAEVARQGSETELARERRQHAEDLRRGGAAQADRKALRVEVESLRKQLEAAESQLLADGEGGGRAVGSRMRGHASVNATMERTPSSMSSRGSASRLDKVHGAAVKGRPPGAMSTMSSPASSSS